MKICEWLNRRFGGKGASGNIEWALLMMFLESDPFFLLYASSDACKLVTMASPDSTTS